MHHFHCLWFRLPVAFLMIYSMIGQIENEHEHDRGFWGIWCEGTDSSMQFPPREGDFSHKLRRKLIVAKSMLWYPPLWMQVDTYKHWKCGQIQNFQYQIGLHCTKNFCRAGNGLLGSVWPLVSSWLQGPDRWLRGLVSIISTLHTYIHIRGVPGVW